MAKEHTTDFIEIVRRAYLELYAEPSKIQEEIISKLREERSVIIHNIAESGMKAVYSVGIICSLVPRCLVITYNRYQACRTVDLMKRLCEYHNVKVDKLCNIVEDVMEDLKLTGHYVAVGPHNDALSLFKEQPCVDFKTVVFDWGNDLFDDKDQVDMRNTITSILRKVGKKVQVVVCVEQKLDEVYLGTLKNMLEGPEVFSSEVRPAKSPTMGFIREHQFVFVNDYIDRAERICEFLLAKKDKTSNTIICGAHPSFFEFLLKRMQKLDIPVSTTLGLGFRNQTLERMANIANEFFNETHVLITDGRTCYNMHSFISERVDSVILCFVGGHPGSYAQGLYAYDKASTAVSFVDGEEVSYLFDIQVCYGIKFERLGNSDRSGKVKGAQKLAATKHIVCKIPELNYYFGSLLSCAEVTVIFVNDLQDCACERVRRLLEDESGVHVTCKKRLQLQEKQSVDSKGDYKPLVYFTVGGSDDFDYFINNVSKQQKVHMVINYDMPSDLKTYSDRVSWCEDGGIVVNRSTHVDWLRLLEWQSDMGDARLEPFYLANVMKYLDKACKRSATVGAGVPSYYDFLYCKCKLMVASPRFPWGLDQDRVEQDCIKLMSEVLSEKKMKISNAE